MASYTPVSSGPAVPELDTVVLDLDGTLVDSVYQHVLAWSVAFRAVGLPVPAWRLHHAIGLAGDELVAWVAGPTTDGAVGEDIRALHRAEYQRLVPTVQAL